MPPSFIQRSSLCFRWLSEIENPPSTDATPSTTPMAWRLERPRFSRISTHASIARSRNAPVPMSGRLRFGVYDQAVAQLDATFGQRGDVRVVGDEDDGVALPVQL